MSAGRYIVQAALFWGFLGAAFAATQETNELTRAREIYHEQLNGIRMNSSNRVEQLESVYLAALDQLETAYQKEGDLHGVLAVKSVRYQVRPDADAKVLAISVMPQKVQALQDAHLEKCRKAGSEDSSRIQDLTQKYLIRLDALKREFTRRGMIDAALSADSEIGLLRREVKQGFPPPEGVSAVPAPDAMPGADMEKRLREIAVAPMGLAGNNAANAFNQLLDYTYHRGIGLKIETGKIPIQSPYTGVDGRPRYTQRYEGGPTRELPRSLQVPTNALDALRLVCDFYGVGYRLEKDLIVIADPEEGKSTWFRRNVQAEALASEFVADGARAEAAYRGQPVRVNGMLVNVGRNMTGNLVLTLQAIRPFRLEMAGKADEAVLATLQRELERISAMQETGSGIGGSRIPKRLGEGPKAAPPPGAPLGLQVSALASFKTQSGLALVFVDGCDLRWQRIEP